MDSETSYGVFFVARFSNINGSSRYSNNDTIQDTVSSELLFGRHIQRDRLLAIASGVYVCVCPSLVSDVFTLGPTK